MRDAEPRIEEIFQKHAISPEHYADHPRLEQ
jgi:hypothetical protein